MPRKAPEKAPSKSSSLHKEIKLLAMAAGGILLLVAVFIPSAAGIVGHFIRDLLIGLLGLGAFLMPVAFIAAAISSMVSKRIQVPTVQLIFILWFVLSLLHIINPLDGANLTAFEYMRAVFVEGRVAGGGIVGAVLGQLLAFFLGRVGAIVVLSASTLILLVLVTGRSFINFVGKGVDAARDYYGERTARRLEEEEDDFEEPPPRRGSARRAVEPAPGTILEIDDTGREPARISLLQEEYEEKNKKKAAASPLFAKREIKVKPARTEILSFPDRITEEDEHWEAAAPDYDDDYEAGFEAGYEAEGSPEAQVLPFISPDDENEFAGLVVKGLVDEPQPGNQREALAPMYADGDDDELLEFDEYARASGRTKAVAWDSDDDLTAAGEPTYENYQLPSYDLLARNDRLGVSAESRTQVLENSRILEETLRSFKVEAKVVEVSVGPTVTRYDLQPAPGVKVASIANLSNDLALNLAAQGIRIEAPVPGKSAVGIEIPNKDPQSVFLREILEDNRFDSFPSKLAFAVGKDIAGSPVITDIARMPHLLIAGATGSGKSVCINTLIASLLYKARPDEVKLLMIDPKVVELSVYNGIPHLLIPVVTDPKKASGALSWAVAEMENRYNMFAETGCRELKGYNKYVAENEQPELPQIVIIIDELADLMMTCKGEVEDSICRLAQKARAAGIHLIVATQRPSVDVITGLIKANIPSRLAFAVSSGTDSRTVLDMYGAEKLLGKGDMLFLPMGQNKPIRVQGGFISDKEVESLVSFLKSQAPAEHTTEMIQKVTMPGKPLIEGDLDEFFRESVEFLLLKGKASTSMLQRQFRIGYNRASRLMEDLEARGIVGPEDGVKPRKVTITREEFRELYG
ncbi:MAG: DNA translocase FtsK [Defluviitaleaceae bacterium]|nr:DNA translocase FtsK [Defluviitaleaceae bacterium]